MRSIRMSVVVVACALTPFVLAGTAGAAPVFHASPVQIVKPQTSFNASQSTNWFGYNQGSIERRKLFNSVVGEWIVPTASQHTRGQAEYSSTWIGIGGGCVTANCLVTDNTLIQTGTEQDVSKSGTPSYSAWWELIPAPGLTITKMKVGAGDRMRATIAEKVPDSNIWKITLSDVTRGETFTQTVPYTSTHATAEWIQETPVIIGGGSTGFAALPNLSNTYFDLAQVNGASAGLRSSEEIQLVDSNNNVIGTPSAPDSDTDGFGLCSWASSCLAPSS